MGMTIDTVTKWLGIIRANLKVFPEVGSDKKIESLDTAISYLKDLEMYQLDYEARLKADMVAMLTEIQMEIEEKADEISFLSEDFHGKRIDLSLANTIIQEKINALKADKE